MFGEGKEGGGEEDPDADATGGVDGGGDCLYMNQPVLSCNDRLRLTMAWYYAIPGYECDLEAPFTHDLGEACVEDALFLLLLEAATQAVSEGANFEDHISMIDMSGTRDALEVSKFSYNGS